MNKTVSASNSTQAWVRTRMPWWQSLKEQLAHKPKQRDTSFANAQKAIDNYRSLARDLASAQRLLPNTQLTAGLVHLYAQLHALLLRKPRGGRAAWLNLLRHDIPCVVRELSSYLAWIVTLFIAMGGASWWLIQTYPDLTGLIASNDMIESVEQGKLWTDGLLNIMPSSILAVQLFTNNITVSILAVCGGFLFGLGTFYIIALNGVLLGATFSFTQQHGLGLALFKFIIAHGCVELSIICLAGAMGAALGDALIRPGNLTRREAFRRCMHRITPLLLLCAVFLVGAGLIEGFISPDPTFPMISRIIIGISYWILMVLTLTGKLWGRP